MKKKTLHKTIKWTIGILLSPIVLFLIIAILIYIPPVQNFVVHRVASSLSESMDMTIKIDRVRLAFPLDLAIHDVEMIDHGDTVVAAKSLRLNVQVKPLFDGQANIDGFSLYRAKVNTKDFISNTYIRGTIGLLQATSHGIEWERGVVKLNRARLDDANLYVALSDTAREEPDTVPSMPWRIMADDVQINRSRVSLSMPGDTMRIMAQLGLANLQGGLFDTGRPYYAVRQLNIQKGAIVYASTAQVSADSAVKKQLGNAAFALSNTLLWQHFKMSENLSANYIALNDFRLKIDTLSYNEQGTLQAFLSELSFKEHSGLSIKQGCGSVYLDSARLLLPKMELKTPSSQFKVQADVNFNAFTTGRTEKMAMSLDANISPSDLKTAAKGFLDSYLIKAWPNAPVSIRGRLEGNIDHLSIPLLRISLGHLASLSLSGSANYIAESRRNAKMQFETRINQGHFIQDLLPASVRGSFNIPNGTSAHGLLAVNKDDYDIDMTLNAIHGYLKTKAKVNLKNENYALNAVAKAFPLGNILPGYGLGGFTGTVKGSGRSFDVLSAKSSLNLNANINYLAAAGQSFSGLKLDAKSQHGQVVVDFSSHNALLEATGKLTASLGHELEARLALDLPNIDLRQLGLTKDTLQAGVSVNIAAKTNRNFTAYSAAGSFSNIYFSTPTRGFTAMDLNFDIATAPDTTKACITAGDLDVDFGAKGSVNHLTASLSRFSKVLTRQLTQKKINQEELRRVFPVLNLNLTAGQNNPLSRFLYFKGIGYQSVDLALSANPSEGMGGHFNVSQLQQGHLQLDTIYFALGQDTAGLNLNGVIHNYLKNNPNKFTAHLNSFIHNTGVGAHVDFIDSQKQKGIDLGLQANLTGDGINFSITPNNPVIAYRKFVVNEDNFIFLGKKKELRADVNLLADDGTALNIYSTPGDSINDVTLSINHLNLGELSNVLPYMPKLEGLLSGDMHITDDHANSNLSAAAQFKATGLSFEDATIGDVGIEAFYMPQGENKHYANAYISTDTLEVLQCEGTYDDHSERFDGTASLHDCPLRLINGFLAGTDIAMRGAAAGELHITGTTAAPVIDGSLSFDSAHIYSDVYGFDFLMDQSPVEIAKSCLYLKNFALRSPKSENPLIMNGTLDMADFSRIALNFNMRATNFELINAKRNSLSLLYGKVYANYIGTLRGTTDNLSVRGKLEILDRTDMTYILKDSPLTVDDRLHDLVQFVSFRDTTVEVDNTLPEVGGFDLTLGISISDAAQFRCSLSEDGQNYVNLEGGGDLTMRITQQGDMRLTGRFTANDGEMKYSLPVIPLKTFNIVQGSYVDFTGDVTNPTLNITAKERVRATVTENDQPRTVPFDVGVQITQPLNNMGLTFIIEATEDLSVQNQLATMSVDQRSKTAVAMLATGMYVTDDMLTSGGSGFKASNALNAFLQSEIQNIAGSALKTIDLSIGMENNTSAAGTETTDYSFQFAKRFWNNRISVIIGGKVSTGADAQNSAESFIDNVAIEYRLDKSATRYVKVFYDRSSRDPLEGQLTQTGAGLVLRRKTDKLGDLFIFKRKKKNTDIDTLKK